MDIKKVAIYCRVSTNLQNNDNQLVILERYANDKGWDYVVFEEMESTRKTRPVKASLLSKLRSKENDFDAVIVLKLDRFARSSTELILDIKEIVDKGIAFISVNDNLDFGTASGMMHFQILAIFSEFERNLISLRTRESLARIKQQGEIKLGRPSGSKDKKVRKKSGYYLKEARKRQLKDEGNGIHKPIQEYLDNKPNKRLPNNLDDKK
jgi:DNA invertase Pin-like site-specific DNA recombinase